MTRVETVVSELFPALPVIPPEVGGPLLRALDLTPSVPAWITDPGLIADILAGHADIPDDLAGGAA